MPESLFHALYYLSVHLLYASLVWLAAWVLTSVPGGSATTKYWIWVATALNFVLPVGAMIDGLWGRYVHWAKPFRVIAQLGDALFESRPAIALLGAVWFAGAASMLMRLYWRLRAEGRAARATAPLKLQEPDRFLLARGVQVKLGGARQAPAVDGVLRPWISLPQDIDQLLSEPELNAVLIHELTHARRRDNLIRLIHELGQCVLWFHPLVWVTSSRLALYRELSCDESVIECARGADLVSALAKLAIPDEAFLLRATASSFISRRLTRLTAAHPVRTSLPANLLLAILFGAVVLAAVIGTVGHTACCLIWRS